MPISLPSFWAGRRNPSWPYHKVLLPEWITVVLALCFYVGLEFKDPFERKFMLSDTGILYPYAEKERVPVWLLGVCFFFVYFDKKDQKYFLTIFVIDINIFMVWSHIVI